MKRVIVRLLKGAGVATVGGALIVACSAPPGARPSPLPVEAGAGSTETAGSSVKPIGTAYIVGAPAAPRSNPTGLVDVQVDSANGVPIYDNTAPGFSKMYPRDPVTGSYYIPNVIRGYCTGDKWECVEFAVRYYWVVFGLQIKASAGQGDAMNYWLQPNRAVFNVNPNGGTVSPKVGDLVVNTTAPHGHIGVVEAVTPIAGPALPGTSMPWIVSVASQNWKGHGHANLTLTNKNGKYTLSGTFGAGSVTGWLSRR